MKIGGSLKGWEHHRGSRDEKTRRAKFRFNCTLIDFFNIPEDLCICCGSFDTHAFFHKRMRDVLTN